MPAPMIDVPSRIESLLLVAGLTDAQKQAVRDKFAAAAGDWDAFAAAAAGDLDAPTLAKLEWSNAVGDWSLIVDPATGVGKDDKPLVEAVLKDAAVTNLRELALKYGVSQLFQKLKELSPAAPEPDLRARAATLRARLYAPEPTAVLARMVEDKELTVDSAGRDTLLKFLRETPAFRFETIVEDDIKPDAPILATIPDSDRPKVIPDLKDMDLLQELAPTPDAVLSLSKLDFDIRARLKSLTLVTDDAALKQRIRKAFGKTGGDFDGLVDAVSGDLGAELTAKLRWANLLAMWSLVVTRTGGKAVDDTELVAAILKDPPVKTLREFARAYDLQRLAQALQAVRMAQTPAAAAPAGGGATQPDLPGLAGIPPETIAHARAVRRRLYAQVPTPVLHGMIRNQEIPPDAELRAPLTALLDSHPGLDLARLSDADLDPGAGLLKDVDSSIRPQIASLLLALKQVERMAPTPDVAQQLFNAGLTTSTSVTKSTEADFLQQYDAILRDDAVKDVARHVYAEARAIDQEQRARQPRIERRVLAMQAAAGVIAPDVTGLGDRVATAIRTTDADWAAAREILKRQGVADGVLDRLEFANQLCDWADVLTDPRDVVRIVKAIVGKPDQFKSLADVARNLSAEDLAGLLEPTPDEAFPQGMDAFAAPTTAAPGSTPPPAPAASTPDERRRLAQTLRARLFQDASTAVVENMVAAGEIPISNLEVKRGVTQFLKNQPNYNFLTTSVRSAFVSEGAFDNIPQGLHEPVKRELESIARLQAVDINAARVLQQAGLPSAFSVSEMPQSVFVARFKDRFAGGEEEALRVHAKAVDIRQRNEQILTSVRDAARGTGFALLDGDEPLDRRIKRISQELQELLAANPDLELPNLEGLFGSLSSCECGECNSVYSPAAYYVDLLNFLRNNNLGPRPGGGAGTNPNIHPGIVGTPLENLFRRRPDLGNLQLTCENTNTVLPYIDLVNEAMESFVVHLDAYRSSGSTPQTRSVTLDVHDVVDETSGELLAQPRYTNYNAYCILSQAVFPFTLPYHQPIDLIRVSLEYLKSSRHQVIDTYRKAPLRRDPKDPKCFPSFLSYSEYDEYVALHHVRLDRAYESEFLGLTQDEYIILVREAFWKKRFFELKDRHSYTDTEYQKAIGGRPTYEYFGFPNEEAMIASLRFIRAYLLKRTGLTYPDLVALLGTQFINPLYPRNRTLFYFQQLRLATSYRFLRALVDVTSTDPEQRYRRLIDAVLAELPSAFPTDQDKKELKRWVRCHFEELGKLIVVNQVSGFPVGGIFRAGDGPQATPVGRLSEDGSVIQDGQVTGWLRLEPPAMPKAKFTGNVVRADGGPFTDTELTIRDTDFNPIGWITRDGLFVRDLAQQRVRWQFSSVENCDLRYYRLEHLDGSAVGSDEYDRLHRFVRLWRRLGWSIDEVDKAIVALTPDASSCCYPGAGDLNQGCPEEEGCNEKPACGPAKTPEIDANLLSQLVSVKKLLPLTGLEVIQQLTFWGNISTVGDKSLYTRLFLTHNLRSIDDVFKADASGSYLADETIPLSQHRPVLMAALKLKEADIVSLARIRQLRDTLTLPNVSALYRHSLLARLLSIRPTEFESLLAVFGDPFERPSQTLVFLELWNWMSSAGLSLAQLRYVITGMDDPNRPVGLSLIQMIRTKKTLFDGLRAIATEHADLPTSDADPATYTLEVTQAKASLIFDTALVNSIAGLLEGTTVYTTNAPKGLKIEIPEVTPVAQVPPSLPSAESLRRKLKYVDSGTSAVLQVTGILTEQEVEDAKRLAPNSAPWKAAVDRVGRQPIRFFNTNLASILGVDPVPLPNTSVEGAHAPASVGNPDSPYFLLSGDILGSTPDTKRRIFLSRFLPYLREQLSRKLVITTVGGLVGLDAGRTELLLATVLCNSTTRKCALETLLGIKDQQQGGTWKGWLLPAAAASYTFSVTSELGRPPSFWLEAPDGTVREIAFSIQQEDPNDIWSSPPVRLENVQYRMTVSGLAPESIQWQTPTSSRAAIPSSAIAPDCSDQEKEVFQKLSRASIVINAYKLTTEEITFFQGTGPADPDHDFNAVSFGFWKKLQSFARFRGETPREFSLVSLFRWSTDPSRFALTGVPDGAATRPVPTPAPADQLADKISRATGWDATDIENLIGPDHFGIRDPRYFKDESQLVRMQAALQLRIPLGVDFNRLFLWAEPTSNFKKCRQIADDLWASIRAKFDQESWEQAVKPLNDTLRTHQRDALIAYLLVQRELIDWGVTDADGLFEFFLIDVKMESCLKTSRIKQAISTVQLFIQRALIGFEAKYGVLAEQVDRKRWEWMQRYRVWEANRKVFLYPENWIRSELRDDKSPFFDEFQSECLQNDLTEAAVAQNLRTYIQDVNTVSNLRVVGLYAENPTVQLSGNRFEALHVVARTRNEPYRYYYRKYDDLAGNWYPWRALQVDIPTYTNGTGQNDRGQSDCFVVPVMWRGRLLLFTPQIAILRDSAKLSVKTWYYTGKNGEFPDPGFKVQWEEPTDQERSAFPTWYENGLRISKDTPSIGVSIGISVFELNASRPAAKETSRKSLRDGISRSRLNDIESIPSSTILNLTRPGLPPQDGDIGKGRFDQLIEWQEPPPIAFYRFISVESSSAVYIRMSNLGTYKGEFYFDGTELEQNSSWSVAPGATYFHYSGSQIFPQQYQIQGWPAPFATDFSYSSSINLRSPNVSERRTIGNPLATSLVTASRLEKIDAVFDYYSTLPNSTLNEAFGRPPGATTGFHELKLPNALYNWETAFHAPMLAAELFLKAQRFDEALRMIHQVFDPLANGTGPKRYWKFKPFQFVDATKTILQLFLDLKAGQADEAITAWRNNPFQPHLVARDRPTSYMKWVVMKYIEILIEYGDYYFRQNTLEMLPIAIQYYVTASHIFGPAPQTIPKRGTIRPQTYNTLLDQWDAFSNAMVDLELTPTNSVQLPVPDGTPINDVPTANIFGFASTLYFCIPDNPRLRELRNTIDDRLFKIRHCQDINGIYRELPLFEPPIDPALLVQAAAQGLSLSSVLDDLNSPIPNYRFAYLLQRAIDLCIEVKALGNAFLAAKEKKDGESIARLRSGHESAIQKLIRETRKLQLEEAKRSLDSLQQSRRGPVYRLQHYLRLVGEDLASVPDGESDFVELQNLIDAPADESGLKLSNTEKQGLDKAQESSDRQAEIGIVETLASVFHALPTFNAHGTPLGVGIAACWGFPNLANATSAVARGMRIHADRLSFQSMRAGTLGGFQRQIQDRIQQANVAGYEVKTIDRQILAQRIRIQMAEQEIKNQEQQVENSAQVEEFLRTKYTSQELYMFMDSELRKLHNQAYQMAFEMAKKAEKVFRFERGLSTTNFITPDYWDQSHDGLFSGERLYQGLKRLEAAYIEKRDHDFEVVKHVSLRQVNPLALMQLREVGSCEFDLLEFLFDQDFPGHYKRRIKSVSLSVPCVVGPHTSLSCTLRLLDHRFRINSLATTAAAYPQKVDEDDERFMTVNVPITSIAVSEGRSDAGVFDLNFRDERYIPFEGAGAISRWRLQFPPADLQPFDYGTISDVVLHLRYTSVDGGDALRDVAVGALKARIANVDDLGRDQGLFAVIDLAHDLSSEWLRFSKASGATGDLKMDLGEIRRMFPYLLSNNPPEKLMATDVLLVTREDLSSMNVRVTSGSQEVNFTPSPFGKIGHVLAASEAIKVGRWQLTRVPAGDITQGWLIVRLTLRLGS